MKSKIIAAVFTFAVLCLTTDVWFCHNGRIRLFTTAPQGTEITLTYRKTPNGRLHVLKQKVRENGKTSFKLKGRTISWFKIDLPENTDVQKTVFHGWAKKKLALSGNEYAGERLHGKISVNLFKFLIIGVLAFWTATGSIGVFYNRNLPKEPEKLPKMMNLEFLRIVFTFAVVWRHFASNFKISENGWLGVEFFFILSGFFLVLTFKPEKTVVSYIKSKWIRFAPLTLFGGLLYLLFEQSVNETRLLSDVFFYAQSGIYNFNGYNPPAWYLSVLMIITIFYFYMMKNIKKEVTDLIIAVIAFFAAAYAANYGDDFKGIINGCLMRGAACVGLGYFLAETYKLLKNKTVIYQKIYNYIEAGVFIFATLNIFIRSLYAGRVVACIAFAGLILMFALRKGAVSTFFEKQIFVKISKYCLAVYLTHYAICYQFLNFLITKHGDWILSHGVISISCVLLSVVVLGVFAHHTIEKPATKALKEWLG